ncbi:hypothetical protein FHW36_11354 [Chitinophaga polysaccharea]|uniref:Uncharacterized protein n=1 Tax=Chitinophaga polysaccharea TaxID=1293035 RepID=A0A561P3V4_9BACT|nr:hypothetical protein FHW36_11354 [Chitinophaga polysaccharea]
MNKSQSAPIHVPLKTKKMAYDNKYKIDFPVPRVDKR